MTAGPDAPLAPAFVVFQRGGEAHVSARGSEEPVFSGAPGAAIQYAIDARSEPGAGAAVAVSPGTYEIERTVTLRSSTWLAGSGTATTLRAVPGLDADLLSIPSDTDHARVSDLKIDGNRAENDRGACLAMTGYTWRPVLERLVVRAAAGDGIRFEGGPGGEYSYEPTLFDVDVAQVGGDGFTFGYTADLFGANLYAEACEGYGFTLADAGGTLVHLHAFDTRGAAGIRVLESAKDDLLLGAHSERNRHHGMLVAGQRITVRDAFVANNSRDDPGADDGIVLDGARDCTVVASTLVNDDDHEPTQGRGVVETAGSRNNRIAGNLFRNHVGAAVERSAGRSGSTYADNRGYRTENGGETTVSDGGVVPHGLDERPRRWSVESTEPGTYAHVVGVDEVDLLVEVVGIESGDPREDVDVTWSAMAR
jgi:hypothetical protein